MVSQQNILILLVLVWIGIQQIKIERIGIHLNLNIVKHNYKYTMIIFKTRKYINISIFG